MDIGLPDVVLGFWTETTGGVATLINHSENHIFRVDGPGEARHILRIHRPGYQSGAAIASELIWLQALRTETDLRVPRPLAGRNQELVQEISIWGELAPRYAVLFAYEQGNEPGPDDELVPLFRILGRFAAKAHLQAIGFAPPAGFTRPIWDAEAILDPGGPWGDWRTAPGITGGIRAILAALEQRLRQDLDAYGRRTGRFGLIHADMRLANLLVDGDRVTLIDFDDCGFGWFVYDFAAAISFYEDRPNVAALRDSWIAGYTEVRALDAADLAAIGSVVLLRRMALLAWIGSHAETDLAQAHAPVFAEASARLAERYLASD